MKAHIEPDDIIEKKVQKDGRMYFGKEYADKELEVAILEVKDEQESDQS